MDLLTVGVTPVALLALAASRPRFSAEWSGAGRGRSSKRLAGVSLIVGLLVGIVVLVVQVFVEQVRLNGSAGQVQRGVAVSPPWPGVANVTARLESFYGVTEAETHLRRTLELARRAVRWDPAGAAPWAYLGLIELTGGTKDRDADALHVLLAERREDSDAREESCRRLRIINCAPAACRGGARTPENDA